MKKGVELTTNLMILILLGLVLLAILGVVFRQQITRGTSKYAEIGEEAKITLDKCGNIILGRACSVNSACGPGTKEIYSPSGKWTDCTGANDHCCESI